LSGVYRENGKHVVAKAFRKVGDYEHELEVLQLITDNQLKNFPKLVTSGKLHQFDCIVTDRLGKPLSHYQSKSRGRKFSSKTCG